MTFGGHEVRVCETDYVAGGLGWRVWAAGVVMCRELVDRQLSIGVQVRCELQGVLCLVFSGTC
jgi:hypothetical protein